jgi:BlaI family penicillinase repressor
MELTKSEMEVMDLLWSVKSTISRSDLLGNWEGKSWKDSSVHIILNGLLQKGIIQEVGVVRCNRTYGRTFEATMTREEYFANTIFSHRYKPQLPQLIAALLERPEADKAVLEEVRTLLDQKSSV